MHVSDDGNHIHATLTTLVNGDFNIK